MSHRPVEVGLGLRGPAEPGSEATQEIVDRSGDHVCSAPDDKATPVGHERFVQLKPRLQVTAARGHEGQVGDRTQPARTGPGQHGGKQPVEFQSRLGLAPGLGQHSYRGRLVEMTGQSPGHFLQRRELPFPLAPQDRQKGLQ